MTVLARKFGVELEGMCGRRLQGTRVGNWTGVSDASVRSRNGERRECTSGCDHQGDLWSETRQRYSTCATCGGTHYVNITPTLHGVEMVSGAITDLNEIDFIFNEIEQHGWEVDNYCGLHVHVDATDFSAADVRRVVILNAMVEPLFYGMNDLSRWDGDYSQPMNSWCRRVIEEGESINLRSFSYALYDGYFEKRGVGKYMEQRYRGLNLHSFFYHETMEFRYFEGGSNRQYTKERVELCVKLVNFAKNATEEQLLLLVARLGQEDTYAGRWSVLKSALDLGFDIAPRDESLFDISTRRMQEEGIIGAIENSYGRYETVREVAAGRAV